VFERIVFNGEDGFEMERPELAITRVSEGLEYGDGKIAAHSIPAEIQRTVDDTIEHHPDFLVSIDIDETGQSLDDDGCGDGRGVNKIFRGLHTELKRSLNRAKVFGGAVAMTAGIWIGRGVTEGQTLESVFHGVREDLDKRGINYGGHTAEHIAPGREAIDSGCGAIDLAPQIVLAAGTYESPIRETLKALGIDSPAVDTVFTNYRSYAETLPRQPEYRGKRVMNGVQQSEKVVKELAGGHLECRIVLNMVRGYTVNQGLIRGSTDGQAQVFAVDVWRLQDIAKAQYPADEMAEQEAFVSELVYTLATAGVLTRGDLPVYIIEEKAVEAPLPTYQA
jgi:hypothetical protein